MGIFDDLSNTHNFDFAMIGILAYIKEDKQQMESGYQSGVSHQAPPEAEEECLAGEA